MAYRALYRTYRPTHFHEIIGQEHITTTLKNQILSNKISHAYLFCGTRGTGKTTAAKVFSRAVNCLSPEGGEPCGTCSACLASVREDCTDITEIDAASNNGVDDVRQLIENTAYAPLVLRRRVFIIDEVHMLSRNAFNALLKTLEEPPDHVLFILATTEPEKLPVTVLSRCQRYNFHRLTVHHITENLTRVLSSIGAEIDPEGLSVIARAANGGMRDALSLTDQCLAFRGDRLTAAEVRDVLGDMDDGFMFGLADALLQGDAKAVLGMVDETVRRGKSLPVFVKGLSDHLRDLLITKICGRCTDTLECTEDRMELYLAQAQRASQARLLHGLRSLQSIESSLRYLDNPRAVVESALISVCRPETGEDLTAMEARIDRLESMVKQLSSALEQAKSGGYVPAAAAAVPAAMTSAPIGAEAAASRAATAPSSASAAASPANATGRTAQPPSPVSGPVGRVPSPDPYDDVPPPDDLCAPPPEYGQAPFAPTVSAAAAPRSAEPSGRAAAPAQPRPSSAPAAPQAPASQPSAAAPAEWTAEALWTEVLVRLRKENVLLHRVASTAAVKSLENGLLTLQYPEQRMSQYRSITIPVNQKKLQGLLDGITPGFKILFTLDQPAAAGQSTIDQLQSTFGSRLTITD